MSVLNMTFQILVFEAIERWRHYNMTIVITHNLSHNLSQIKSGSFVYMLKHGSVVEKRFRRDLEIPMTNKFRGVMDTEEAAGGLPRCVGPGKYGCCDSRERERDRGEAPAAR